jgi:hypothetical protein
LEEAEVFVRTTLRANKSLSTINSKNFQEKGKFPKLKPLPGAKAINCEEIEDFPMENNAFASSKQNAFVRQSLSRKEQGRSMTKKSSSGLRGGQNFKIPITQSHGKNRRGLSNEQMGTNPEDLNLLFYDFNNVNKNVGAAGEIFEEQPEFEEDFELGPTNCKQS